MNQIYKFLFRFKGVSNNKSCYIRKEQSETMRKIIKFHSMFFEDIKLY